MLADTPFETKITSQSQIWRMSRVLTGYMGTGLELSSHLWVHRDHHLLLGANDGVALFNLVGHPGLELTAEDDCANIHDPLLGHLLQIDVVWQEVGDVRLLRHELEDALDREVLVLRDE